MFKTIGSCKSEQEVEKLYFLAKQELERLSIQPKLFISESDTIIEQAFDALQNACIKTVGPEIIFGRIYNHIGFNSINENLFKHLVIARLAFPLSKLKTIEYLYRFQGVMMDIDAVYRFLDRLNNKLKSKVEQIAFAHTKKILNDSISVVFYDMTTLYFEASDEDDYVKPALVKRKTSESANISWPTGRCWADMP